MSNQQTQRVRRIASPSLGLQKQGPMRATFHFGLRQSSPTAVKSTASGRGKNSPSSSPTPIWGAADTHRKNPRSPDHRSSPDRGSPSSPFIKTEKSRPLRHSPIAYNIKRTSSLDTIAAPYLEGLWPRETVVPYTSLAVPSMDPVNLTAEKGTQTPEEWEDLIGKKKGAHIRSTSLGNGDSLIKIETIKARLAKTKEVSRAGIFSVPRTSPVQAHHAAISTAPTTASVTTATTATATPSHHSKAVNIPHIPKSTFHMRGSVEGLSQEIETLVLRNSSGKSPMDGLFGVHTQEPTPDGHRAPIAELLTTRTVDTQTPLGPQLCLEDSLAGTEILEELEDDSDTPCSSRSSSQGSLLHGSSDSSPLAIPIMAGHIYSSRPSSTPDPATEGSTTDTQKEKECSSPDMKYFSFVREPPDGCEKVKTVHEETGPLLQDGKLASVISFQDTLFCPIKKPESYHIPSEVSAFTKFDCPLLKPYVRQPAEMKLRSPVGGSTSQASQTCEGQ